MILVLQIALGIVLGSYAIAFIVARLDKPPRSNGKNSTNAAPPIFISRKLLSDSIRVMQFVTIVGLLLVAIALVAGIVRIVLSAVSSMPPLN
jgi:hypothetical protein